MFGENFSLYEGSAFVVMIGSNLQHLSGRFTPGPDLLLSNSHTR